MKSLLLMPVLLASGLRAAESPGSAPASLTREEDLTVVSLKPAAEKALRLRTVEITSRAVAGEHLFSGEVVLPLGAGKDITIAPMMNGNLDESLRIADLQAAADGRIRQAEAQVAFARTAGERARKIHLVEAGSVQAVEEAVQALAIAEAGLATAKSQRELLGSPVNAGPEGRSLWVRVPVYSGEVSRLDTKSPARILDLTAGLDPGIPASTVTGPVTANGLNNTVDFYYQLPNGSGYRPGLRVGVKIPKLAKGGEMRVVPCSAIVSDIHGGHWVYTRVKENAYARRRVQVERWDGTSAVLASGPAAGTSIVTDGAAELFGTEFMTGK